MTIPQRTRSLRQGQSIRTSKGANGTLETPQRLSTGFLSPSLVRLDAPISDSATPSISPSRLPLPRAPVKTLLTRPAEEASIEADSSQTTAGSVSEQKLKRNVSVRDRAGVRSDAGQRQEVASGSTRMKLRSSSSAKQSRKTSPKPMTESRPSNRIIDEKTIRRSRSSSPVSQVSSQGQLDPQEVVISELKPAASGRDGPLQASRRSGATSTRTSSGAHRKKKNLPLSVDNKAHVGPALSKSASNDSHAVSTPKPNRLKLSKYQTQFTPGKSPEKKVATPSPKKHVEEKVPPHMQKEQMELLQLCLLYSQGCKSIKSWQEGAEAYFNRSFEELSNQTLVVRQSGRQAQQRMNILALKEWFEDPSGTSDAEIRLSKAAEAVLTLSEIASQSSDYHQAINLFEHWLSKVDSPTKDSIDSSPLVIADGLDQVWSDKVSGTLHKSYKILELLHEAGDARTGSTLSHLVTLTQAQASQIRDEMIAMQQIERHITEIEKHRLQEIIHVELTISKGNMEDLGERKGIWQAV